MSTLSKKEIQLATTNQEIHIKPLDSQPSKHDHRSIDSSAINFGIQTNEHFWNKINYEILYRMLMRLIIIIVTAISFMELERNL